MVYHKIFVKWQDHLCMRKSAAAVIFFLLGIIRQENGPHLGDLTKNAIKNGPLLQHTPLEENHMAEILPILHLVDGVGHLLPHHPLSPKIVWNKNLLSPEMNNHILLQNFMAAGMLLATLATIRLDCANNVDNNAVGVM